MSVETRERSIRYMGSVPHWAGMDIQHASMRAVTLESPFSFAIEVLTDENLVAKLQKLVVMHERHTMGNEQAMPALTIYQYLWYCIYLEYIYTDTVPVVLQ